MDTSNTTSTSHYLFSKLSRVAIRERVWQRTFGALQTTLCNVGNGREIDNLKRGINRNCLSRGVSGANPPTSPSTLLAQAATSTRKFTVLRRGNVPFYVDKGIYSITRTRESTRLMHTTTTDNKLYRSMKKTVSAVLTLTRNVPFF